MGATGLFQWLPERPDTRDGSLGAWYSRSDRTVYSHLHFSNYGKFAAQMTAEAAAIRALLPMDPNKVSDSMNGEAQLRHPGVGGHDGHSPLLLFVPGNR